MGKKDKAKITVTKEIREDMIAAIKSFFSKERDEELGDLASGIILDFIVEELAPEFYNQGVYDSHVYMTERCEELLSIQKKA